jgi:rhodanese-related sulfurtransferase
MIPRFTVFRPARAMAVFCFFAAPLAALLLAISDRAAFAVRDTSAQAHAVSFIDAAELMTWIENGRAFELVDARAIWAYEKGHIAAAVNIRRLSVYDSVAREPIVVYCDHSPVSKLDSCFRAVVAALQNGQREVHWFKGGISAWRAAGFALENYPSAGVS